MGPPGKPFDGTTHPGVPSSSREPPRFALVVVHPAALKGQYLPLSEGTLVGRIPEGRCAGLAHETVSRRHAEVVQRGTEVLCLRDLGSRNGTSVNGVRMGGNLAPLVLQAVVRLGDVLGVVVEERGTAFADDGVLPGTSVRILEARRALDNAAREPRPVLVRGETGTGKERVAAEIHRRSGRNGPFVALNCAELSPQLIESQLFGHERGAFTGATASKSGLFEQASGGTLFLDEVGELPLDLQPKLLRVIQEGELRPLGSSRVQPVDVRVVSATNRDLPALAEQGLYRRDLLARLSTWEVLLPPLRERREDLLSWVDLLLERWNRERGTAARIELLPALAEQVLLKPWPDNLRGLDRFVHRLAAQRFSDAISVRQAANVLPDLFTGSSEFPAVASETPPATGEAASAHLGSSGVRPSQADLLRVYDEFGGNVRAVARHYRKDRRQIYRWLETFGIRRPPEND